MKRIVSTVEENQHSHVYTTLYEYFYEFTTWKELFLNPLTGNDKNIYCTLKFDLFIVINP